MKYNAVTVTQLNKYLKDRFEEDENLGAILVKGEISNFKNHYTGHLYFTLKDENSLIKCIMFKSYAERLAFKPKDGMKVMVFGSVSVFERDGVYQIYVKQMMEDGMGDLHEQFEKLKAQLEAEGLFDEAHKKPIPLYPKVVGVLTSQTGAVIRDIINVSTRRNPNVYIRLLPVPVQGPGAAEQIAEKIKIMNEQKLADVLIIGRGGGSLEDLLPFSEECVVRAISQSEIPVVSAVGHEIDWALSDYAADKRAPTPSAAAEVCVPQLSDIMQTLRFYQNELYSGVKMRVEKTKLMVKAFNPDNLELKFRSIEQPLLVRFDNAKDDLMQNISRKLQDTRRFIENCATILENASPQVILDRGYSMVREKSTQKIIRDGTQIAAGAEIEVIPAKGKITAVVTQAK